MNTQKEGYNCLMHQGLNSRAQCQYKKAAGFYTRALELKPNSPEAHHGLAVAYAALGKVGQSIMEFNIAIRLKPRHTLWQYEKAWLLQRTGDSGEALKMLDGLSPSDRNTRTAHLEIAIARLRGGLIASGSAEALKWKAGECLARLKRH